MVRDTEDSPTVMRRLHQRLRVRLHAIGVSDRTTFERWFRAHHPGKVANKSAVPDHELLRKLVEQGGGDPARVGDTEVLEEYFKGLGHGAYRTLPSPTARNWPGPNDEERRMLDAFRRARDGRPAAALSAEAQALAVAIQDLYHRCNLLALQKVGRALFLSSDTTAATLYRRLPMLAVDQDGFALWILQVNQVFWEGKDDGLEKAGATYEAPAVAAAVVSDRFWDLNLFRLRYAHDKTRAADGDDERERRKYFAKLDARWHARTGGGEPGSGADARWTALQLSLMRDLRDVMTEVEAAFAAMPPRPTTTEASAASAGGKRATVVPKKRLL